MQSVKLVGITKPVTENIIKNFDIRVEDEMSAEDFIVYCARVSNPANQTNFETGEKLLKYCIRKKHWSIFEMVNLVMEIKTTRDIGRQILRHRSFHFQEFSQRYAEVDSEKFILRECRLQDPKNRQNSIETNNEELKLWWIKAQTDVQLMAMEYYAEALAKGIAKEQARVLLPEGLTPSTMYMNGTLRDWYHYSLLRMANGTQKEHSELAHMAWDILKQWFDFLKEIDATLEEVDAC